MQLRQYVLTSTVPQQAYLKASNAYDEAYGIKSQYRHNPVDFSHYADIIVACLQGLGYERALDIQIGKDSGKTFLKNLHDLVSSDPFSDELQIYSIKEQVKRLLIDRSQYCLFTCNGLSAGKPYHEREILVFLSPLVLKGAEKACFVCPTCKHTQSLNKSIELLSKIDPFPLPLPEPLAIALHDWCTANGHQISYTGMPFTGPNEVVCSVIIDVNGIYTPGGNSSTLSVGTTPEEALPVTTSRRRNPEAIDELLEEDEPEKDKASGVSKETGEYLEDEDDDDDDFGDEESSKEDEDFDAPVDDLEAYQDFANKYGKNVNKMMVVDVKPPTDVFIQKSAGDSGYGDEDVVITATPAIDKVPIPVIEKVPVAGLPKALQNTNVPITWVDSMTPEDGCIREPYRGPKVSGEMVAKGRSKDDNVVLSLECGPTTETSLGFVDISTGDIKKEAPYICTNHPKKPYPIYWDGVTPIKELVCPRCESSAFIKENMNVGKNMFRKVVRFVENKWTEVEELVPAPTGKTFASRFEWQNIAVDRWANCDNGWAKFKYVGYDTQPRPANYNGIVEACTGSGKTKLVIKCIDRLLKDRANEDISITIIVPASNAVQYQWFCELQNHGLKDALGNPVREFKAEEIALFGGKFPNEGSRKLINLYVVNTAAGKTPKGEKGEVVEETEENDLTDEDVANIKLTAKQMASPLLMRHLFGEWKCKNCGQPALAGNLAICRACKEPRGDAPVSAAGLKPGTKHFLICDELHRYSPKAKFFSKIFDAPLDYSLLVTGTMISGEYSHLRCKECNKTERVSFSYKINKKGEVTRVMDKADHFKGIKPKGSNGIIILCKKRPNEAPNDDLPNQFRDVNIQHTPIDAETGDYAARIIPFINFYQKVAGPLLALYTYPEALWKRNIAPFRMWFVNTPFDKHELMSKIEDNDDFTPKEKKNIKRLLDVCSVRKVHELTLLTQYILDYKGSADFQRNLKMLVFSNRLEPIKIVHKYLVNTIKSDLIATERRVGAYHSLMSDYYLPCSTDPIDPVTQKYSLPSGIEKDPSILSGRFAEIPAISIYGTLWNPTGLKKGDTELIVKLDDFKNGIGSAELLLWSTYVGHCVAESSSNTLKVTTAFNKSDEGKDANKPYPTRLTAAGNFPGRVRVGSIIAIRKHGKFSEYAYVTDIKVEGSSATKTPLVETLTLNKNLPSIKLDNKGKWDDSKGVFWILTPIEELPHPLSTKSNRHHHKLDISPSSFLNFFTKEEKEYLKKKLKTGDLAEYLINKSQDLKMAYANTPLTPEETAALVSINSLEALQAYINSVTPEETSYDEMVKITLTDPCPTCGSPRKEEAQGVCKNCGVPQRPWDKFYKLKLTEGSTAKKIKTKIEPYSQILVRQNAEIDRVTLQNAYMDEFRVPITASSAGSGTVQIMLSGKALVEGIDVPDVDIGVAFSPMSKDNPIPNLQSLGRVLRVKKYPPGAVDKNGKSIEGEIIEKDYIVLYNQLEERVVSTFRNHLQLLIDNEPEWVCAGGAPHNIDYADFFTIFRKYYDGLKPITEGNQGEILIDPPLTEAEKASKKPLDTYHKIIFKAPANVDFTDFGIKKNFRFVFTPDKGAGVIKMLVQEKSSPDSANVLKLGSFPFLDSKNVYQTPKDSWDAIDLFNKSNTRSWAIEKDFPVDRKKIDGYIKQAIINFTTDGYTALFPEEAINLRVKNSILDDKVKELVSLIENPLKAGNTKLKGLWNPKDGVPKKCKNKVCKHEPCTDEKEPKNFFGKFGGWTEPPPGAIRWSPSEYFQHLILDLEKTKENVAAAFKAKCRNNTKDLIHFERHNPSVISRINNTPKMPKEIEKKYYCELAELRMSGKTEELMKKFEQIKNEVQISGPSAETYLTIDRYEGCVIKNTRGKPVKEYTSQGLEIAVAGVVKKIEEKKKKDGEGFVYIIKEMPENRVWDAVGNLILPDKLQLIDKYVVACGPFISVFADSESAAEKGVAYYAGTKCPATITQYKTVDNHIIGEIVDIIGPKPFKKVVQKAAPVAVSKPAAKPVAPVLAPVSVTVTLNNMPFVVWEDATCQIPATGKNANQQLGFKTLQEAETAVQELSKNGKSYYISVESPEAQKPFGLYKTDQISEVSKITNTTNKGSKHLAYASIKSAIMAAKTVHDKSKESKLGGISALEGLHSVFISNIPADYFMFEDAACKDLWLSDSGTPYIFSKNNTADFIAAIKDVADNQDFKNGSAVLVVYFAKKGSFRLFNASNVASLINALSKS